MYWVVNDKHIILFGFGSRILSSFKVIERDSAKPFLSSKEGEKAGVNRFKFEVKYHTNTIQTKFVFVCMTFFEGLFSFPLYLLQIWSENNSYCQSQMILFSSNKTWKIINVNVGDKIYSTLGVVQLFKKTLFF